jgi:lysophospholipase L1-like esterase
MKRALFTIALLMQCLYLFSQSSVIQVKQDSVKIRNAELVIESRTKGIPGVLYNSGDGKTEFRRIELKNLGDTAIAIVGQDTLKYSSFGGASGKSVQFKTGVSQGYPGVGDSIYTNTDFIGKNLKIWRNGVFQYRDPNDGILIDSSAGKIIFRPALAFNDRVYIEATAGISLVFELPPMAFSTNLKLNAGVFDYGTTQTLRWTTNHATLNLSPRVVGLGSSTLAGHGLTGMDRLGDKIIAWLGSNTTSPEFNNLSVGGYASTNLLPVADGGTAGHNIDSALNYKPDFIFISLPSNDIVYGLNIQQTLANYRKIDNLALSKGVPIFWETPQPRTQFNASEQTRLKVLADSVRAIWPTRFVEGFSNIVSAGAATDAVIKPEYAQSDGVHLTGAGVQQIANSLFARWKAYFQPIYGVSSYEIQQLDVSGSNEIVSDPSTTEKSYSNPSRLPMRYSVKANFTNGTSIVSNIATFSGDAAPPAPSGDPYRILVDLGGDGVNTTAGSTKLGQVTTSPDFNGNYWNNWFGSPSGLGFNNNSTITNLVTADNTVTPISMTIVGNPYGNTGVSGTNAININGFYTVSQAYPSSALSDNMFLHNSINPDGIILRIEGLLSSKHYEVKLWGARIDGADSSPSRMLEASTASGSETWTNPKRMETRYFTSETPNFNRSIVFSGLTGPGPVDIHLRPGSGSSYAHVSLVDIKISDPQGAPSVDVQNATITMPASSVQLTGNVNANGNTITDYLWTQVGSGPTVATLSTPTSINCTMGNLTNGTYTFRLTVKTSTGGQYADEATVTVLPASSGAKTLRVHFSANATTPIPGWFNMFGDVTNTHIVKTDPATGWIVDNVGNGNLYWKPLNGTNAADNAGQKTGNNTGVVPDDVLANYWFVDNSPYASNDNLWIRGLNPAKSYTIKLVASRHMNAGAPRYATWRINGGAPIIQNALGNTSQQAVVTNVVPDGTGKIRIAVYTNADTNTYGVYSYINGLIIEEQ